MDGRMCMCVYVPGDWLMVALTQKQTCDLLKNNQVHVLGGRPLHLGHLRRGQARPLNEHGMADVGGAY